MFARFKAKHGTQWDLLPEKAVFQLNDTHPTIAVAEVMRLLVDVEGLAWDHAWSITTKVRGLGGSSVGEFKQCVRSEGGEGRAANGRSSVAELMRFCGAAC